MIFFAFGAPGFLFGGKADASQFASEVTSTAFQLEMLQLNLPHLFSGIAPAGRIERSTALRE